jgi:hypothetical protein
MDFVVRIEAVYGRLVPVDNSAEPLLVNRARIAGQHGFSVDWR